MIKRLFGLLCLAAIGAFAYGQFTYNITPTTPKCAGSIVTYSLNMSFQGPGDFISYTWGVVGGEFSGGGDSYVVWNGADIQAEVEWDTHAREDPAALACRIDYWTDADPPQTSHVTTTIYPQIQGVESITGITGNTLVYTGNNSTTLTPTDGHPWHVDEYRWTFTPDGESPRTYTSDTDDPEQYIPLYDDEWGIVSVSAYNALCGVTSTPYSKTIKRRLTKPVWAANSNVICNNSSKTIAVNAIADADDYTFTTTGGFTVWNSTSSSWVTSVTQSSPSALVKGRSSNGIGTISATAISDEAPNVESSFTVTKNLWSGTISNPYVVGTAAVCPNTLYNYYVNLPIAHHSSFSYVWTKPSNWSVYSQITNSINLYTPSSPYYGTVRVTVTNECGSEGPSGITVYPGYSCGGYYMVSPNPSAEFVDIAVDPLKIDAFELTSTSEISITVFDNMGTTVYAGQITELPYRINTAKYRKGEYIVTILTRRKDETAKEQQMESIKIIVNH